MVGWGEPSIGEIEVEAVEKVMRDGWLSRGKVTEEFEAKLSEYIGSNVGAVDNCTSALLVALKAVGVKPNQIVVVPDFTFIATASAPAFMGARVLPVDVYPYTFNIDVEKLENVMVKYSDQIGAVIITDICGLPNDYIKINDLLGRHNIPLIEDAAQAFGAEYGNRKIGSFPHITTFSFQATKLITTVEGGAFATLDEELFEKCKSIADYGRRVESERYLHQDVGINARITDLQSALGLVQLAQLPKFLEWREKQYQDIQRRYPFLRYQLRPQYVTRHPKSFAIAVWDKPLTIPARDNDLERFLTELRFRGVDARRLWRPIHSQPCFPELNGLSFPVSETIYEYGLTLPLSNKMET